MELKPGYKQVKREMIPESWERKPISSFSSFVTKGATPTTYGFKWEDDGVLFLRSECVSDKGLDLNQSMFISGAAHTALIRGEVKSGDILITITGNVGRVIYLKPDFGCANINQHIARIRVKDPGVLSDFVYYWLSQPSIRTYYASITTGQAYPQISLQQVRDTQVPLPSLPEQHAIAGALGDVDVLLGALDRLIAKKCDIMQATMQRLLTGRQRLPGFTEKWVVSRIAENSILKARIGWQGLTTAEYLSTGSYYLVTGTDFVNGRVNWTSCCFVDTSRYVQDKNIQLKERDILLTKDGTIGKVGFVDCLPGPATLNSGVFVIRPKNDAYDPLFFYYILTSRIFENFLVQLQAGSTISHLYQKDFVNFSFYTPSMHEQTAIASVLSDMDAEIAALERRRDKTRALKQGMMQELLTGRIRLV
jgi:type I restriction enzyme, S subunit